MQRSRRARGSLDTGVATGLVALLLASGSSGHAAEAPNASAPAYLRPSGPGPKATDPDGFLKRWLLLEPISRPNVSNAGFTRPYVRQAFAGATPGPLGRLPATGATVDMGGPLTWRAMDAEPFDVKLYNYALSLGKPVYGVIFWAATVVDSPREVRDVRLSVGSNSASMWWLNGREVVGLYGDRRMVADDGVSDRVVLHKGRNVLYGAVINGPGLSDFCARFVDDAGRPVTDLVTRTR